jgi:hypothetical protein
MDNVLLIWMVHCPNGSFDQLVPNFIHLCSIRNYLHFNFVVDPLLSAFGAPTSIPRFLGTRIRNGDHKWQQYSGNSSGNSIVE